MRMNMENEELVKMVNPTLKMRETILFFLIVVINGLKCIVSDIRLDTCARGRWRVEVSKLEMNQPFGSSYLTAYSEKLPWTVVSWGRQVREGLHRLQSLANQGLESP